MSISADTGEEVKENSPQVLESLGVEKAFYETKEVEKDLRAIAGLKP
jgi:hypothetical protein